jgi:hypothetical protein
MPRLTYLYEIRMFTNKIRDSITIVILLKWLIQPMNCYDLEQACRTQTSK